jgi:hypothetical protein
MIWSFLFFFVSIYLTVPLRRLMGFPHAQPDGISPYLGISLRIAILDGYGRFHSDAALRSCTYL